MLERVNFCWESISEICAAELPNHLTAEQGALNISSAVVDGVLTIRKNNARAC